MMRLTFYQHLIDIFRWKMNIGHNIGRRIHKIVAAEVEKKERETDVRNHFSAGLLLSLINRNLENLEFSKI